MALQEKTSKHLGIPYVYIPEQKKFLCQNGVLFTLEEYKNGINLNAEYERRLKEDKLYDYTYAKSTGILRKKRSTIKVPVDSAQDLQVDEKSNMEKQNNEGIYQESVQEITSENTGLPEQKKESESISEVSEDDSSRVLNEVFNDRRDRGQTRISSEVSTYGQREKQGNSALFLVALLAFTSIISGYISTLHTATYLYDYVDHISAWLMSTSVTAYNTTAFEVSVIFKSAKRYGLTFVFISLWTMVTLFSMATTVSVFYDQFNFAETQIAKENKQSDSNKLALELLRTKEKDLRESIEFKKKDIEYRQEHDYATTAVRTELNKLQEDLQKNLTEQENLLKSTPEITEKVTKRKESLFSFLGRLLKIEGGILEFIMSTLSAIFVNLIAPMSLVAVTELKKKEKLVLTK